MVLVAAENEVPRPAVLARQERDNDVLELGVAILIYGIERHCPRRPALGRDYSVFNKLRRHDMTP